MRVLIAAFSVILAVSAYDAVLFSNNNDISSSSVDSVVKSASADAPVVFIVNPDFTLGQFSVKVNAYSAQPVSDSLAKTIKSSKYHDVQYFANQIYTPSASVITSVDQLKAGESVYIVAGEEWTSMESLAEQVVAKLGANFVGVVTSADGVTHDKSRVKRVVTDEMEEAGTGSTGPQTGSTGKPGKSVDLPLILPPYNQTDYPDVKPTMANSCLMYLEGLTVVVEQRDEKQVQYAALPIRVGNATWSSQDGDIKCPNGTIGEFIFRVRLQTNGNLVAKLENGKDAFSIADKTDIDFTLNITGDLFGYWQLTGATLNSIKIDQQAFKGIQINGKTVGAMETQYSGIQSVAGFSLTCGETQAIFFSPDDKSTGNRVGIALYNSQIQTFNLLDHWTETARFTLQVEDCTGTFSPGSWMGIVSALVLVAGLLFGYMMLQSVQTMDRFDDPKHKQIVINVRE